MLHEGSLKVLRGLHVLLAAAVRTTVHALLVYALFLLITSVPTVVFPINLRAVLLALLLVPLGGLLIWVFLMSRAAYDISLEIRVFENDRSYREQMARLVMPVALMLGSVVLLSLIVSRPIHSGWLFGEEPLLGLALGYFLAPLLIRRRVLARFLERTTACGDR